MAKYTRSNKALQCSVEKVSNDAKAIDFFEILSSPAITQELEIHMPEHRNRTFSPSVALAMYIRQVLNTDKSCQKAVNEANGSRLLNNDSPISSHTGGYWKARERLPLELVKSLSKKSGELVCDQARSQWNWKGRTVKLVDGTTITLPDTPDNQLYFPQHGGQAKEVGFPIVRLVVVMDLASGAALDLAAGAYRGKGTGEHSLFRELQGSFNKGDIMLADAYYCSYFLIAEQMSRGVDVLFEQHGARHTDFRCGKRLGQKDHLVCWSKPQRPTWMTKEQYESYPAELTVREVQVKSKVLVTSFLSSRKVPKKALGDLYNERWHIELDLRNIKTTLGMESLRCKTAQRCKRELWIYMLAYNIIRLMIAGAAQMAKVVPRTLSFKHTVQLWLSCGIQIGTVDYSALLCLIAQKKVGNRPGRIEPRALKKRPKPYPRLMQSREIEREKIRKKHRCSALLA